MPINHRSATFDGYAPTGVVRPRSTEKFLWHDTNQPTPAPLPPQRGKIIESHQKENTVDVRLSDGSIVRNVPSMSPHAGTSYGSYRTPKIKQKIDDRAPDGSVDVYDKSDEHDHYVVVQWLGGDGTTTQRPIVVGSIMPEINHFTNEGIGHIDRTHHDKVDLSSDKEVHASYTPDYSGRVISPDPDVHFPQHIDPQMDGPKDFDKRWKLINQDDKKFSIIDHQQSGDITTYHSADGRYQVHKGDGNGNTLAAVEIHNDGHITLHSTVGHTFDAPSHTFTGTLFANGGIQCPATIQTTTLIAAGGAGPPSPLGGPGGPGSAGNPVPHDFPLTSPPNNPHTEDRGYDGPKANN